MILDAGRIVLLALLVVLGLALIVVGSLGWRGRLAVDGRIGLRTPVTTRTPESFRLANHVAGPPMLAAGLVAVLSGVAAVMLPGTVGVLLVAGLGFLGTMAIAVAGGVLGQRAATLAKATAVTSPCAGCACGGCGSPDRRSR